MTTELNTEVMRRALDAAKRSLDTDDVPVGALVLDASGQVIGEGWNTREGDNDPCGHAEIMALRAAGKHSGRWNLSGCTLVVTLEPCTMCAGAIVQARIGRLVFGAWDPKAGAAGSMRDVVRDSRLNHQVEVIAGVCAEESRELLRKFFETRRSQDTGEDEPVSEGAASDSVSDEGGAADQTSLSVNDAISGDVSDALDSADAPEGDYRDIGADEIDANEIGADEGAQGVPESDSAAVVDVELPHDDDADDDDAQDVEAEIGAETAAPVESSWSALVGNDDDAGSSETAIGGPDNAASDGDEVVGEEVPGEEVSDESEDHPTARHNAPPVRLAASPPPPAPPADPHHALAIAGAAAPTLEKARQEDIDEGSVFADAPALAREDESAEIAGEEESAGAAESLGGTESVGEDESAGGVESVGGTESLADAADLPSDSAGCAREVDGVIIEDDPVENFALPRHGVAVTGNAESDTLPEGEIATSDRNDANDDDHRALDNDREPRLDSQAEDAGETDIAPVEGLLDEGNTQRGAEASKDDEDAASGNASATDDEVHEERPGDRTLAAGDLSLDIPDEEPEALGDEPETPTEETDIPAEEPAEFEWLKTPVQTHDTTQEEDLGQVIEAESALADTEDEAEATASVSAAESVWTPPLPKMSQVPSTTSDANPENPAVEIIAEEPNSTRIIDDIPAGSPVLEGSAIDVGTDEEENAESFISAAREFAASAEERHGSSTFPAAIFTQAPVEAGFEALPQDGAPEDNRSFSSSEEEEGDSGTEYGDSGATTISELRSNLGEPVDTVVSPDSELIREADTRDEAGHLINAAAFEEPENLYESLSPLEAGKGEKSAQLTAPHTPVDLSEDAEIEDETEGAALDAESSQENSEAPQDGSEREDSEDFGESTPEHASSGPTTAPTRRVHRAHLTTTGLSPEDFPKRADIHGVRSTMENRGVFGRLRAVDSPPPSSNEDIATPHDTETHSEADNVTTILPDAQRPASPEAADQVEDHQPDTFGTGALDTPVTGLGGYVSRRVRAQATHDSEVDEPDTSDTIDLRPVVDAINAHEVAAASSEETSSELSDTQLRFLKLQDDIGEEEVTADSDLPADANHGADAEDGTRVERESEPTPIPSRRSVLRAALAQAGLKRTTFLSLGEDEGGAETSTGVADGAETSGPAEMAPPNAPEHVVDGQSADTVASDTPAGIVRTPIASRGPRTGIFDAVKPAGTTGPIPSVTSTGAVASADSADAPVGSEQKGRPHTPNPADAIDALGSTGIGRTGGIDSAPSEYDSHGEGPSLDGEAPGVVSTVSHVPDNPQEDLTETRVIRGRRPLFPPVGVSTPPQGTPVETSAGLAAPEQHSPVQGMPPVNTPVVPSPPPPVTPPGAVAPPPPPVAFASAPNPPGGVPLESGLVSVPPVEGVPSAQMPSPAGHTPVHGASLPPPQGEPVVPAGHVPPGSAMPIPHDSARAGGPGQPGETLDPVTPVNPRGNGAVGQASAPDSVRSGAPTSYPDPASPDTPGRPMLPLRSESPQRPPQSARSGPMMGVFAKAAKLAGSIPPPEEALSVPTEVPGSTEGAGVPAAETDLADTGVLPGVALPVDAGISPEGLKPPEAAPELPAEIPGEEPEDDTEEAFKKLPKWLTRRGRQKPTPKH